MEEIMFRNLFSKKKSVRTYHDITADMIAAENGMECIHSITEWKKGDDNGFYARKGMYILMYPANDGYPTCPFKWYTGKGELIMDNQSSFKCITNLDEIILDMIKLYTKYIDADVFISSLGFAMKLEDEVCPEYIGKAKLALAKEAILNHKVKPEEKEKAKKYCINYFLDHYIGWNFGVVIKSNSELEKALIELNELVISKGLREDAGSGLEVWQSNDVMPYKLNVS